MTGIDRDALRAAAENQSIPPGPWFAKHNDLIGGYCVMPADLSPFEGADRNPVIREVADFMSPDAAAYISKVPPSTVLSLLDSLEAAEKEWDRWHGATMLSAATEGKARDALAAAEARAERAEGVVREALSVCSADPFAPDGKPLDQRLIRVSKILARLDPND